MHGVTGLRASFAAIEKVAIKRGPNGPLRRIIAVESDHVITEPVNGGRRSRISRDGLARYVVVRRE